MRRGELIFNYIVMLGPLVLVFLMVESWLIVSAAPTMYFWVMTALFLVGFVLFFKAKLSIIMSGKLFKFGPKEMSKANKVLYLSGYATMGLAFVVMLGLALDASF